MVKESKHHLFKNKHVIQLSLSVPSLKYHVEHELWIIFVEIHASHVNT